MKTSPLLLLSFLFFAALSTPARAGVDLSPGIAFPVIRMPDSQTSELKSIADFRGEKLMLQIFASW
ncbi:MAG: hypothetical protein ACI9R3_003895 [Verrucomicrobiales bacterium]|jgi:hypothetical protein